MFVFYIIRPEIIKKPHESRPPDNQEKKRVDLKGYQKKV